jgi:hypothetical protein
MVSFSLRQRISYSSYTTPLRVLSFESIRPRNSKRPVFDFRAHFCHAAPMETHAFGCRLRANAPEGQKRFPISGLFCVKIIANFR